MLSLTMLLAMRLVLPGHVPPYGEYDITGNGDAGATFGVTTHVGSSANAGYITVWDEGRIDFGRGYFLWSGGPTIITTYADPTHPHVNAGLGLYTGVNLNRQWSIGVGVEGPAFMITQDLGEFPSWMEIGADITYNTGRHLNISARAGYCYDFGDPGDVCGSVGLTYKWYTFRGDRAYINL